MLAAPASELLAMPEGEASASVAARVAAARALAVQRQGESNAQLAAGALDLHCVLDEPAARILRSAAESLGWSGRRPHRCLKVARAIADLAASAPIITAHLAEALQLQRVLPG